MEMNEGKGEKEEKEKLGKMDEKRKVNVQNIKTLNILLIHKMILKISEESLRKPKGNHLTEPNL